MSDVSPVTDEQRSREAAAKQRFFALSLFRLSGEFILMFAFLIMLQQSSFVSAGQETIMRATMAWVGMFQTIIIPSIPPPPCPTPPPPPPTKFRGFLPITYPPCRQ